MKNRNLQLILNFCQSKTTALRKIYYLTRQDQVVDIILIKIYDFLL